MERESGGWKERVEDGKREWRMERESGGIWDIVEMSLTSGSMVKSGSMSESLSMMVVLLLTWCLTNVIYATSYQCLCKLSVRRAYRVS